MMKLKIQGRVNMNIKNKILIGTAIALLSVSVNAASASCSDMHFTDEMMGRFPDLNEACMEVIEHEGKNFAKIEMEVVRASNRTLRFKLHHRDGGSSDVYEVRPDSDLRINLSGQSTRIRDLTRGQVLSVYLPDDRFTIGDPRTEEYMDVTFLVVEIVRVPMLPTTSSPLFLFALFGVLLTLAGGALTTLRRRRKE
ncbi:MAG TPA: LPXTG cell wall anchor domain-containing protein [Gammaproteobacteria bacterium]|nr:LPXTG cell wall anchor domain-containing protein [Gammaproteobacteria bacterium]HIL98862.1 LPXTG cell wall anchor domain-containing protein [Pseudomonadales bacterium]